MTDDDLEDDLGWHALNYRTAHTVHADAMWELLAACVDRKIAAERERCKAAVMYSQCRNGYHSDEHGERIGHYSVRMLEWIESGFDPRLRLGEYGAGKQA